MMQAFIFNEVKDHTDLQLDSMLNNFYITNKNASIGLIRAVNDSIQTGNYTQATAYNNSIMSANVIEANQKMFNAIYLAKLDSIPLYSSADSSNLYSIASQCAGEGGNAVHQSRNLLMFLENRVINFTENCPEIVNERRTDITKTNSADPNIRLYPR